MQPADEDVQFPQACFVRGVDPGPQPPLACMPPPPQPPPRGHTAEAAVALRNLFLMNISNWKMVVRPAAAPPVRFRPYAAKERPRTKSENNEEKGAAVVGAQIEPTIDRCIADLAQLKKAKSLESVVAAEADVENANATEVEVVSDSIQRLKVDE